MICGNCSMRISTRDRDGIARISILLRRATRHARLVRLAHALRRRKEFNIRAH